VLTDTRFHIAGGDNWVQALELDCQAKLGAVKAVRITNPLLLMPEH